MNNIQGSRPDKPVTNEVLLEAIVSVQDQIIDIRQGMKEVATKDDLSELEGRLTKEMRTISKAVDKDALTIVDHGKRLTRVEKHLTFK